MNLPENAEYPVQRDILDALPALVFLERGGRVVFANAEARHVMGLSHVPWEPRPIEDVLWGLFPGTAEPQTALSGSREGSPFHATLTTLDGRILPVEGTYRILNPQARQGIVVAHIGARERAPKPRLVEDVLASIPEAVAIVHGGNVLFTNPSFTRMFGYTAEEASGKNLRDLIVPDTRYHENAMLQRTMEDQERVSLDTVRMHKSGELLDVAMHVAPLMVNGQRAGFVLTYRDIGDRKEVEARLQHDAMHDVLTGLPNRALFEDRLKLALSRRARNRDQSCGVLFFDLDRFKAINETLGHAAGDMLLMAAAGRLRGIVRPQDTAARLGGVEFGILVEGIVRLSDLEGVAQRLLRDMERPFDLLGHRIQAGASLGVAFAAEGHETSEALMRDAAVAMYRARQAGGGRYEVFDRSMEIQVSSQKERERQLREVVDKGKFQLWYEPMFRLANGHVEGFEAQPRWRRPDGSIDTLRDLLPLAEGTGFSISMGRDIIEMVCKQSRGWHDAMPGNTLLLSIDLTRRQFFQDDLVAQVKSILTAAAADPAKLMFEIPEDAVTDNPDRAIAILQRLVDCGVRVALDHFGAGLAPLNHLVRLPLDMVKLDQSLTLAAVEVGRRLALLESLIHVAKSVGVQMLAQGIQTQQQLAILREMGCELGQGHLLSMALEPAQALQLAAANRPAMILNA